MRTERNNIVKIICRFVYKGGFGFGFGLAGLMGLRVG